MDVRDYPAEPYRIKSVETVKMTTGSGKGSSGGGYILN